MGEPLFTLRCMEARNLIDPVILQQQVYGGRSMVHRRFCQENPAACTGEDGGLFAVLAEEFSRRAAELPSVFDPQAPAIALRPSVSALKHCLGLLSGSDEDDALFQEADTLGWPTNSGTQRKRIAFSSGSVPRKTPKSKGLI